MELNYQIYVGTMLLICWSRAACVEGMLSMLRDICDNSIIRAILTCI